MTTVRKSLGFAFLERYVVIGVNLVSFTLLARLLTPEQIGLYSVSMALISVAQVIRDFGLSNYLIQRKTLDSDDIGTALGMSLLLGGVLFILVNAGASSVGEFYKDKSLTAIVRIISLNFLILPFNAVLISLMRRNLRFDVLMRINICAALATTLTTLSLAWGGFGSWSLAWGEIAGSLTSLGGALMSGANRDLLRPRLTRWREVLSFGGPLTLASIVTSVSMDISDLVVGKVLNFSQVAISNRAHGLVNLLHRDIMGTVRAVAYPAFSKAHREDAVLEQQFVFSMTAVTAIAWPFYGFLALFPLEVLRLLFGPQWDQSAPLVPWFCLGGAFSAMVSLIPTLMLAAGHARLTATADLVIQPVKAVALSAVIFHYRDLLSFAVASLIMAIVAVPYFYAFKQRCLPTDFAAVGRSVVKNLLLVSLSLIPASAVAAFLRQPGEALPYPLFFGCAAMTLTTWLLLLWALDHPLHYELRAAASSRFLSKSNAKPIP